MTEPTPNLPLLRAVLAQIDAHPERWNQKDYATRGECGTAFCVAGWAVHLTHPTEELGLSRYEADRLFRSSNSRGEVQYLAEQIAARAGESL